MNWYVIMTFKYLSEIAVAVDVLLLMAVLQLIVFDIEPESLHDAGTSLCVHSQQSGQTGIQFVLRGLRKSTRLALLFMYH